MSLLKMTILSFSKTGIKQLTDIPQLYMVMFNPNSYKTELKVNFDEEQPQKSESGKRLPRFTNVGNKQFSFDFLVDGTGAAGYKRDVGLDVKSFIKVVGYDKNVGEGGIRYLLLMWGGFIQKCVIESISVNYTLFSALGSPLRATISAGFREYNDEPEGLLKDIGDFFDSNPVQGIMSVANVAFQAFNAVSQTVAIAKANDLDSIRESVTGGSIKLP
ncbi:MAG: hypothetical protein V4722_20645 [Bacteroidota bacterium]